MMVTGQLSRQKSAALLLFFFFFHFGGVDKCHCWSWAASDAISNVRDVALCTQM